MRWYVGLILSMSALTHAGVDDFARVRTLVPAADDPVQRILIPRDVYEISTRDDLGDVRPLNAAGEELPFVLRRPLANAEPSAWQSLPIFELPAESTDMRAAAVNIELADGGTVVAVRGGVPVTNAPARLLVDASGFTEPMTELAIGWPDDAPQFIANLQIEASSDLSAWRTIVVGATIATLAADGQQVRVDRVSLPHSRARYLRITQSGSARQVAIDSVSVRSEAARLPERDWIQLPALVRDSALEFDTRGRMPIDRVALARSTASYIQRVSFYSRPNAEVHWRGHGTWTCFRAVVAGEVVESEPAAIATTADRFWRVEFAGGVAQADDQLRVGWLPHELVFVAQGPAPFALAYGAAGLKPQPWPLTQVLARLGRPVTLDSVPVARLSDPAVAGGDARLQPLPEPVDWRTLLLWGVLVIGVAVIGGLALRLARSAS